MSISDVYYCSGCVGKDAEELEKKALMEEAEAEKENPDLERPYEEISGEEDAGDGQSASAETQTSVITAGLSTSEKKQKKRAGPRASQRKPRRETVPESTSGVITAPSGQKSSVSFPTRRSRQLFRTQQMPDRPFQNPENRHRNCGIEHRNIRRNRTAKRRKQ